MRTFFTVAVMYSVLLVTSEAQSVVPQTDPPRNYSKISITDWSHFQKSFTTRHSNVLLTTKADPSRRIKCQVLNITSDAISCGGSRTLTSYTVADIAFVYAAHHVNSSLLGPLAFFLATSGGAVYGTALVASTVAASIPLGIFAFFLLFIAVDFAIGFSYEDFGSRILYQMPNPAQA